MKELLDLHAFADGELSQEEAQAIRRLIAEDGKAQIELSAISNLIDCLKNHASQHKAEECWQQCVGRLNELEKSKKVEGFVGRYSWAMCAALFVLILGARYAVKDVRGDSARAADLIRVFHSAPAISPQQEQLYSDLIRSSKQARSGVQVVRHTTGTVMDVPVDRIDLLDRSGTLTLFVMQGVINFEDTSEVRGGSGIFGGVISSPTLPAGAGVNCVVWVDRGRTYVLAGQRPLPELADATGALGLKADFN